MPGSWHRLPNPAKAYIDTGMNFTKVPLAATTMQQYATYH